MRKIFEAFTAGNPAEIAREIPAGVLDEIPRDIPGGSPIVKSIEES